MDIDARHDGALALIGFNRPGRRNAITAAMYDALADAITAAEADDAIHAIVLHGTADTFTAGNDIEDFIERPPSGPDTPVFRFLRVASEARKPLIAAVEGAAVGIGTTVLLHCDLAYAADNARFQLPFARLGLVPEFGSSLLLPQRAGHARAAEMLLLGEPFDAAHALACGLLTKITAPGAALATAIDAARRIAALPRESVALTKTLMKAPHAEAVRRQIEVESEHFRRMLGEPAARAALAAFLARRKS